MALRIRRGTEAQRANITFDLAEIIWTTDGEKLYVGDGVNAGGKNIAAQLAGTGLVYNATTGKLDAVVGISGDLILNGNDITGTGNIDITGDIGASGTITGDLSGNILTTSGSRSYDQELNVFYANGVEFVGGSAITSASGELNVLVNDVGFTTNIFNITKETYTGTSPWVQLSQYHGTADADNLTFSRARGTLAAPLSVQTNDDIIDIAFAAHDGTAFRVAGAISMTVTGSISTNVVPTRLSFQTHGTTSASNAARLTIDSTSVSFISPPKVPVFANTTARDAAITSPAAGMICFISGTSKFQGNVNSTTGGWSDLN
jgi:hypothetical protein